MPKVNAEKRMRELEALLEYHSRLYYELDTPEIEDAFTIVNKSILLFELTPLWSTDTQLVDIRVAYLIGILEVDAVKVVSVMLLLARWVHYIVLRIGRNHKFCS